MHAWSEGEIATVRRALDKLAEEHEKYPDGIDDYVMGRRARILAKLNHPGAFMMYGVIWDINLVDAEGKPWRLQQLSTPETFLVGFAVSRDRYRVAPMEEPEGQTLVARIMNWFMSTAFAQEIRPKLVPRLDGLVENVDCYIQNTEAIKLFDKIDAMQHSTPGGASPRT